MYSSTNRRNCICIVSEECLHAQIPVHNQANIPLPNSVHICVEFVCAWYTTNNSNLPVVHLKSLRFKHDYYLLTCKREAHDKYRFFVIDIGSAQTRQHTLYSYTCKL